MNPYFDALAERLRESGASDQQIRSTIDDLATHVAESGADPAEEFGPVAEFASELTAADKPGSDGASGPRPGRTTETWVWRADAFAERERLNEYGDQGWEVEYVDALGRFVSRRDLARPQRWEYRRETVILGGRREPAERLAPDGWEPCGTWVIFEYFKRPRSAILGPAGELDDAPRGPGQRAFWSRRYYAFIAGYAILLLLGAIACGWLILGGADRGGWSLIGLAAGGAVVAGWVLIGRRRAWRREP